MNYSVKNISDPYLINALKLKKILPLFFAVIAIASSCSKEQSIAPVKNNLFKISLATTFSNAAPGTSWQQITGGKAMVTFTAVGTDTLTVSPIKDSLDLKKITVYTKQIVAATYNITLNTTSIAAADTFIRFNASVNSLVFNQTQTVSLAATTNDGVITISKSIIGTNAAPTFTPAGGTAVYSFGLANGYYFIYVKGAVTGRLSFTEAISGDLFLRDLTVDALNQYDISAVLNPNYSATARTNFAVSKRAFQINTNSFK